MIGSTAQIWMREGVCPNLILTVGSGSDGWECPTGGSSGGAGDGSPACSSPRCSGALLTMGIGLICRKWHSELHLVLILAREAATMVHGDGAAPPELDGGSGSRRWSPGSKTWSQGFVVRSSSSSYAPIVVSGGGFACAWWNHDARVLHLVAKNSDKSRAIYRSFWYGLIENLET
jgi:hypothetical protein